MDEVGSSGGDVLSRDGFPFFVGHGAGKDAFRKGLYVHIGLDIGLFQKCVYFFEKDVIESIGKFLV